jgi:uncharacterized membrane protein
MQPDARPAIAKVPATRALAWYGDAMRLWKRGPVVMSVLAAITILAQFAFELWPDAGSLLAKVAVPLIACGMLFAADAAARGERPRLVHAIAAFRAPAGAVAAIVLSSAITFAAEWVAADRLAGIDLLRPEASTPDLDAGTVIAIYAAGILASLPMTFVPLAALFGGAGFASAFSTSAEAFVRNVGAFLAYGAIALLLLAVGLLTMGIGLVVALPLIACATWAAWREICPGDVTPSPPA